MLERIYDFFEKRDIKNGSFSDYSYETAPFCGHHFNGHDAYWTRSAYHEGDGGQTLDTWLFTIELNNCNYDNEIRFFWLFRQALKRGRTKLVSKVLNSIFEGKRRLVVTTVTVLFKLKFRSAGADLVMRYLVK